MKETTAKLIDLVHRQATAGDINSLVSKIELGKLTELTPQFARSMLVIAYARHAQIVKKTFNDPEIAQQQADLYLNRAEILLKNPDADLLTQIRQFNQPPKTC